MGWRDKKEEEEEWRESKAPRKREDECEEGQWKQNAGEGNRAKRVSISSELIWEKFVLFIINKLSNPIVHLAVVIRISPYSGFSPFWNCFIFKYWETCLWKSYSVNSF